MERMDRARRIGGLLWVGVGLAFQVGWAVAGGSTPGTITMVIAAIVIAVAVLLLVTGATPTSTLVGGRVLAVVLALDLAGAVADRFGAFGAPGGPGVSWGGWPEFVDYTRALLGGIARPLAELAAVTATGIEVLLAVALVAGFQRRWTGKATAALLVVYLVAMALSLGLDEVATYAVPVIVGGALLVSACPSAANRTASPAGR